LVGQFGVERADPLDEFQDVLILVGCHHRFRQP
jgi:hypothetical protein